MEAEKQMAHLNLLAFIRLFHSILFIYLFESTSIQAGTQVATSRMQYCLSRMCEGASPRLTC